LPKFSLLFKNYRQNPLPLKTTKLVGTQQSFRIRVGDYRIVYNIFFKTLIIEIVRAASFRLKLQAAIRRVPKL
jgi:mRNA-degrading endonuclease RelE of RelBE toxin-antitoxin system